jgi:hypothetical protein
MKRAVIVIAYSIAVTALLLLVGFWQTKTVAPVVKTDYSALWQMAQAKEAPKPRPEKVYKEAAFKDKSMTIGVDAKPTLSVG